MLLVKMENVRYMVYLKKDERLAEYKVKDKYFNQSNETGLSKRKKIIKNLSKNTKTIRTFII